MIVAAVGEIFNHDSAVFYSIRTQYVDYSDDEAERQAKAKKKNKRHNHEGENGGENVEKKNK